MKLAISQNVAVLMDTMKKTKSLNGIELPENLVDLMYETMAGEAVQRVSVRDILPCKYPLPFMPDRVDYKIGMGCCDEIVNCGGLFVPCSKQCDDKKCAKHLKTPSGCGDYWDRYEAWNKKEAYCVVIKENTKIVKEKEVVVKEKQLKEKSYGEYVKGKGLDSVEIKAELAKWGVDIVLDPALFVAPVVLKKKRGRKEEKKIKSADSEESESESDKSETEKAEKPKAKKAPKKAESESESDAEKPKKRAPKKKPVPEPVPEPESESESEPESDTESVPEPEPEPKKSDPEPESESDTESVPEPEPEPAPAPEKPKKSPKSPKSEPKKSPKPAPKPEPKSDSEPESDDELGMLSKKMEGMELKKEPMEKATKPKAEEKKPGKPKKGAVFRGDPTKLKEVEIDGVDMLHKDGRFYDAKTLVITAWTNNGVFEML